MDTTRVVYYRRSIDACDIESHIETKRVRTARNRTSKSDMKVPYSLRVSSDRVY